MKCPICGCEGFIQNSEIVVKGDESPDTPTQVFRKLNFYCRNPNCKNYNQNIGEQLNPIYQK